VHGAFKYTSSILSLLIFLDSGVFWVFWDLLLFLSSISAILLGDVIASKNKSFEPPSRNRTKIGHERVDSQFLILAGSESISIEVITDPLHRYEFGPPKFFSEGSTLFSKLYNSGEGEYIYSSFMLY